MSIIPACKLEAECIYSHTRHKGQLTVHVQAVHTARKKKAGYGMAVLPWLDITVEGTDKAEVLDSDDIKEAVLQFLRDSTTAVNLMTGSSWPAQVLTLTTGKAVIPKLPPAVFPEFTTLPEGANVTTRQTGEKSLSA